MFITLQVEYIMFIIRFSNRKYSTVVNQVCHLSQSKLQVECRNVLLFRFYLFVGAHSLGSCKFENSGFQGPWDFTPEKLDNGFYKSMRGIKWESLPISG